MTAWKNSWEKVVLIAGLGLTLLLPLVVDIACAGPFRTPKSLLANVFWGVLAAVFVVRPAWDRWLWPMLAVSMAAVFSALTFTPAVLWAVVPWTLATFGIAALRQLPGKARQLLARAVVVGGVVESLLAIAFFDPGSRPASYRLLEESEGRYAWLATLGNPADVASFLVLPALAAFAWSLAGRRRVLWLSVGVLQSAVILATQTLSVIAALLLGLGLVALRAAPPNRRWRMVGGLALVAVLVLVGVPPIRQRLVSTWFQVHQGWLWLASGRGAGWTSAFRMFLAHPLLGVGFGQFEAHSFLYLKPEELAERGRTLGLETGFGEAHNEPLQYLAETGLLGFGLLVVALCLALRGNPGTPNPGNPPGGANGPLRWPAPAFVAAAGVVALFQFPLHLAAVAAQWAVVAALLLPPLSPPPPGNRLRTAFAAGLALLVTWGSWQQWRAERAVQSANVLIQLLRQRPRDATRQAMAFAAYQGLERKLHYLPFDYQVQTTAGNLAQESGNWEIAVRHFRRALALAERPETHFNLGVALIPLGEEREALSHLVRATELNPAVLRQVTDRHLAAKLKNALEAHGYFRLVPWAEGWIAR